MKPLRAIVVDDEKLARRGLSLRLQNIPQIEVIAECVNGQEALREISTQAPDVVFLDIQMPGMDGFSVVCELQSDAMPLVIFVTAFDQYAVEAFNIHAVDYLLKPIEEERLQLAVERALERHAQRDAGQIKGRVMGVLDSMDAVGTVQEMEARSDPTEDWPDRLTIKDGTEFQFIKVAEIQWIDAAGDYMCVHASGKTHIMRTTMKHLEDSLDPGVFLRIHRSSIVNANFITAAQTHTNGEYILTLEGGAQLKVSRGYRDRVRPLFGI